LNTHTLTHERARGALAVMYRLTAAARGSDCTGKNCGEKSSLSWNDGK